MRTWNQAEMRVLEEVFPDFDSGSGIFDSLVGLSFIPDSASALSLNLDYFLNRSGRKIVSPLVSRICDDNTGELTSDGIVKLANIIKIRFTDKWENLWDEYVSETGLLDTISIKEEVSHGKVTTRVGSEVLTKSGSEVSIRSGEETRDETFPESRKSSRTITGSYKDEANATNTRTGVQDVTESFPTERKSSKSITGGYKDTDTTATTRTGKETVTDKGDTSTTSYGFNSSNGVKTQKVGPDTIAGTTTETDYGTGLKDERSGDIEREYQNYKEETSETGSRKMSTTFGENGLQDEESGSTTRTYDDYKDETVETGSRRNKTTFNNLADTLSYNNRQDSKSLSDSVTNSGKDTTTQVGFNIRRLSDKVEVLKLLYESPIIHNFFEVVYSDLDEILTVPVFG